MVCEKRLALFNRDNENDVQERREAVPALQHVIDRLGDQRTARQFYALGRTNGVVLRKAAGYFGMALQEVRCGRAPSTNGTIDCHGIN